MTAAERFAELWTDFLEGDLDDAGRVELDTLLADPGLVREAVDSYRIHRLLGLLAADTSAADAFVAETMVRLPAGGDGFTRDVMQRVGAAATTPRAAPVRGLGGWLSAPAVGLAGMIVIAGIAAALAVVAPRKPADTVDPAPAALASVTQTLFPLVADPGEPPVGMPSGGIQHRNHARAGGRGQGAEYRGTRSAQLC